MALRSILSSPIVVHYVDPRRESLCFSSRNSRATFTSCRGSSCSFVVRSSSTDGAQLIKSVEEESKEEQEKILKQRMKELYNSMILPENYLGKLPNDLKTDLKDAAFALANGPVQRECGEIPGEKLLQLSRAWEKGDTQAATLAMEELQYVLPRESSFRNAIGKRLIGAGRRFASTGSYAEGELQLIAKALVGAGEAMQSADGTDMNEELKEPEKRVLKFGELQVELTSQKCFIGCIVALGFGALSWALASSVQNVPESASQYTNDNATLLATSLKGALIVLGYGCTVLSGFAVIGLLGLGLQLSTSKSSTAE